MRWEGGQGAHVLPPRTAAGPPPPTTGVPAPQGASHVAVSRNRLYFSVHIHTLHPHNAVGCRRGGQPPSQPLHPGRTGLTCTEQGQGEGAAKHPHTAGQPPPRAPHAATSWRTSGGRSCPAGTRSRSWEGRGAHHAAATCLQTVPAPLQSSGGSFRVHPRPPLCLPSAPHSLSSMLSTSSR